MKFPILAAAVLVAATTALSASAQGQPWLKDRRYGEGIGIRTGNLELHPSVAGELGYDTNYFQRAPSEVPIDVARLRLTPSLSVSTLGPQRRVNDGPGAEPAKVGFNGGVWLGYDHPIAIDSEHSDDVAAQRDVSAGAELSLEILPGRPWGGYIEGDFLRTAEPSNSPDDSFAWKRNALRLGAGAAWRPGGGLFEWRLGYELRYNFFEAESFQELNNTHHYLKTRGRWRFLPRTALLYDAEFGFINYGASTYLNDSTPVRSRLGITGLVTQHFGLLALIGWGASFYSGNMNPQIVDYDSVIAQGEVKWYLQPQQALPDGGAAVGLSSVAVGYVRDFRDTYISDYYQYDRGYARLDYFLGGLVLLSAEAGFTHHAYPAPLFPYGGGVRNPPGGPFAENRVNVGIFGEYRLSDTWGVNLTGRYDANLTDAALQIEPGEPGVDRLQFRRLQIFAGARWFM